MLKPDTLKKPAKAPPKPKAITPRVKSLSERRAKNREQMIETIIDSAREIMRENGVHTFNMQLLAKTVGIQAPSLYEYFASKNAIFDALYSHGLEIFQQSVFKELKNITKFSDAVRHVFTAELDFSRKHPDLYQIIFNNALPGYVISPKNRKMVAEGLNRGVARLTKLIEKESYPIPISNEQAALLVDVVLSGVSTRLLNVDEDQSDEFQARSIDLVDAIITLLTGEVKPLP